MQTAAVKSPKDEQVLGEYGKALADAGQLTQAKDVLTRAYTPGNPKWDVMSVQGVVADRLGDLALAKQLPEAERTLRPAVASPKADSRMRGDLALVLALEGKYAEPEEVSRTDLPPETARANVDTIRQLIADDSSLRALRKPAGATKPKLPSGAAAG
jgi:Flp pilus assembly protein TadD